MHKVAWIVLLLWGASCGGEDQRPGAYSESCSPDAPCQEGLSCLSVAAGQICSISCSGNGDCSGLSQRSFCPAQRVCVDRCTDSTQCPAGLPCTMLGSTQGMCVPALGQ